MLAGTHGSTRFGSTVTDAVCSWVGERGRTEGSTPSDLLHGTGQCLKDVTIFYGDWTHLANAAVTTSGDSRSNAILLDPPYPNVKDRLYDHHDRKLLARCREFALAFASTSLKVALCGYEGDLAMPDDWEELPWGSQTGRGGASGSARTAYRVMATSWKLRRTPKKTLEVHDGVLFDGHWLPRRCGVGRGYSSVGCG